MDIVKALKVSVAVLRAQTMCLRVSAKDMAKAETMGDAAGADPYRRKTISFKNILDKTDFKQRYDPCHPAA